MNQQIRCLLFFLLWMSSVAHGQVTTLFERDMKNALSNRDSTYTNQADWPFIYYLSLGNTIDVERDELRLATKFMVASTSMQPILEDTIPVDIPQTNLLRIDIRLLGWEYADWHTVIAARYPYHESVPLVIRADWLLLELADMHASDSYHRLLYGGNPLPKTRDEVLKKLGVANESEHKFGLIEGQSGVSVQGIRLIENRPVFRGYAWGTSDVLALDGNRDPLLHPTGTFPFDGQEWIIGVPKLSRQTGDRGALQVYFLNDKNANLVGRAPIDLVVDETRFRGLHEIRVPGSCIQCHTTGINPPTTNEVRELINSGISVAADKQSEQAISKFHLGDPIKEVHRNQDDYQSMVEIGFGVKSSRVSEVFKRAIERYEKPLDLVMTAEEMGVDVKVWADSILRVAGSPDAGPRLPGLIKKRTIPRRQWEEDYLYGVDILNSLRNN